MFSINTNVTSLEAQNNLNASSAFQSKTIQEVTSGLRIVDSGDDAAGLAIANGMRSDQAVLTQGIANAGNGLNTLQTIDGGMNNISLLLDRARTLATQSASGTFTGSRADLNNEFQSVLSEINRQSQAIGMNTGGQFAQHLSVFVGGGKGLTAASVIDNGSVSLDLSKSTVDTKSLGLNSFQAATPTTNGVAYDLGAASSSSVSKILAAPGNTASESTTGFTQFTFRGAGFSDTSAITLSVNVAGVTDTTSLANAINAAISAAANPTSATTASTAFNNAGITANITTSANGQSELSFTSATAAFQVSADDRTANALMGNFSSAATATGAAPNTVSHAIGTTTGAAAVLTVTLADGTQGTIGITDTGTDTAASLAALINSATPAYVSGGPGSTFAKGLIKAYVDTAGNLAFTSTNGQSFTIAGDTEGALVIGQASGTSTVNGSTWDSGGAQVSSEAGTVTNGTAFHYGQVTTGQTQNITFSGVHSDGTQYSISTTLNNANTATVDTTLAALNAGFQASADPSMQKIVAVKDMDSTGSGSALGIKFISSDPFSVTLGNPTGGSTTGLTDTSANAPVATGAVLASTTLAGAGVADVSNQSSAAAAVSALATAVATLGTAQANVGKGENEFNYAMNLAQSQSTNLAASESTIRDANLAAEAANLTKAQILIQAGTAALAQANSAPQAILALLK